MMKNIKEIKISSYDVEQRVFTYSYYVGEARRNSGVPLKLAASMQASIDDHVQLNDHIDVATSELVKMINSYFCVCKYSSKNDEVHDGYIISTFMLTPPQYFPDNLLGELQKMMTNYLVMRTLQQWILQHKPDEAVITASETERITLQLRELMNSRVKPRNIIRRTRKNIEI